MRVHALVNRRAGTVLGSDPEALRHRIERAFTAAGHAFSSATIEPDELDRRVCDARADGMDAVIVAGGDGTVRAAARVLTGGPVALGIFPLGTFNRLARDLDIPLDCAQAADALARPTIRAVDVAEVNGRIFLCNSFLGLPPEFTEARQRLRGRPLLERIAGYVRMAARILASTRRLALTIDDGAEQTKVRAITLVVANNAYSEAPSLLLRRQALDGGELAIYIMRHRSGWGVALTVLRAMLGMAADDPAVEQMKAHRVVIRSRRHRLPLSNDGELEVVATPLVYSIRPKALRLLVPAVK